MADNTSTTKKYLDKAGLVYLWGKIKETFVKKTDLATTGTTGLVTGGTFKAADVASGYSEAPIVNGVVYYKDTVYDDTTTVKASKDLTKDEVVLGAGGKNAQTTGVTLGGATLSSDTTAKKLATETAVNAALTSLKGEIGKLENVMNFLGVVQVAEGKEFDTTNATVIILGEEVTADDGDVVVYGNKEYVWNGSWIEIGQVRDDEAVTSLEDVKGDITLGSGLSMDKTNKKLDVELAATQGNVTLDKTNGLKADVSVTNNNATLTFGSTSTIASVAGTEIKVTMPADPTADISALSDTEIQAAIDEAEAAA